MKKIINLSFASLLIIIIGILAPNYYVMESTKNKIVSKDFKNLKNADCILVLGAAVYNGKPKDMLADRIKRAYELYQSGVAPKIIMSGDHIKDNYDEVNVMKSFAKDLGIPSEDIFMDHAGISTYDSIYRAKEIFGAKKIVIVTQDYHLYRALYIASKVGLDAYGVESNLQSYRSQTKRDIREVLARDKDFVKTIFLPKPYKLGEKISLKQSGDITNDK